MSVANEECKPVGLRGTIQLSDGNDCFDGTHLANVTYTYNSATISATNFSSGTLLSTGVVYANASGVLSTDTTHFTYDDTTKILSTNQIGGTETRLIQHIDKFDSAVLKGQPVYITVTSNSGNIHGDLADSADVTAMPAIGLAMEGYARNAAGYVIRNGLLSDIADDVFDSPPVNPSDRGKVVYVNGTGLLTLSRPGGSTELIQNIGVVTRINGNGTTVLIQGAGRANDNPNRLVANDANVHQTVTIGGGSIRESTNLYVTGNAYVSANITTDGTFYAGNMRGVAHGLGVGAVHYNPSTKELTYSTT
jgi:hypothetical protein